MPDNDDTFTRAARAKLDEQREDTEYRRELQKKQAESYGRVGNVRRETADKVAKMRLDSWRN